ncbi:MAG: hypothetical protein R2788_21715 [Saprospiraceae bacterium]
MEIRWKLSISADFRQVGYTLLVVDAEGCEKEAEFTSLTNPPVLTVGIVPNMEITLGNLSFCLPMFPLL